MKVGMYRESMGIPEEEAWGVILADAARHLAQALQEKYGEDQQDAIEKIKNSFLTELAKPTSKAEGGFV